MALGTEIPPLFRLPITDMGASIVTNQQFGRCGDFELRAMNCIEAYGYYLGKEVKCKDLIRDYMECMTRRRMYARYDEMKKERLRQYYFGKREKMYIDDPKYIGVADYYPHSPRYQ